MKIKKGDNVIIVSGKDKGKTGVIARALPKSNQVIIEGVNLKKRHQRARKQGSKGQIVDKAMPINISNIQFVDPKKGGGTRIKITREEGKRVRVAKKSGAVVGK